MRKFQSEYCDFTKKIASRYAVSKLILRNYRNLSNPKEVSTDSNSLEKIKKCNPKYTSMHIGAIRSN